MWMLIARTARADAIYWPGRRWLALADALIWPALWFGALAIVPSSTGIVGLLGMAIAVHAAARRAWRAWWHNERYWFTTWRWGRPIAIMLLLGWLMKLLV